MRSPRRELREAVDWYAAQAPGLGDAFLIEALRAFDLIESYPDAWPRRLVTFAVADCAGIRTA